MKKPFVYICLSIDTEGPLYEDIVATFQRLENILEVKIPLKPTKANLEKLRAGDVDFLTPDHYVQGISCKVCRTTWCRRPCF